ncbi:hypothetical protein BaRGS_00017501 [Batillaria attramentaria]|uniref:Uncharacterized protein n=1 Tax=Batillaria attramentaria TaxID=370345 RepID=A0ABD0KWQ4_9CAEN
MFTLAVIASSHDKSQTLETDKNRFCGNSRYRFIYTIELSTNNSVERSFSRHSSGLCTKLCTALFRFVASDFGATRKERNVYTFKLSVESKSYRHLSHVPAVR